MKLRTSTLDRIAKAYAEAVAQGDFAAAEGWIRTATFVQGRLQRGTPSPVLVLEGSGGPAVPVGPTSLRRGLFG